MAQLQEALARLHAHPGVQHVLLLGHDGLLVRHLGDGSRLEPDTVAAMVPGLVGAAATLGRSGTLGEFGTGVLEFASGVAVVAPLSGDLLLAILLRPGVGFAPLLREVRRERAALADLL